MGHQDRYIHIAQNIPGDASKNDFAETRMAVSTHYQEIGIELSHLGQDRVGDCEGGEIMPNNLHSGI